MLLIDGYNLLNASYVASRAHGRTELERARLGLLDFLSTILDLRHREQTTVVFDASNAPPGLPDVTEQDGMTVLFARDHESADALIEERIAEHPSPRLLVVVSSDHRLHRAARRRKARAVDSDQWLREQMAAYRRDAKLHSQEEAKPARSPNAIEVAYWVEKFSEGVG